MKAEWEEGATVTFNYKGHGGTNYSVTLTKGSTATEPSTPSATGYTFGGWYSDSGCTSAWDFSTTIDSSMTLYAKWTAKTYSVYKSATNCTITVANQGTFGSALSISWTPSASVEPYAYNKQSALIYSGSSASGSPIAMLSGDTSSTYTMSGSSYYSSICVVIVYEKGYKQYKVTIAAGEGGSGAYTTDPYTASTSSQTMAITLPTKEHHYIDSWTASGYTGTAPSISGTTLTIPANTYGAFTMTPTWGKNTYAITVVASPEAGGTVTGGGVYAYQAEATLTASAKTGYQFEKWSDDVTDATRKIVVTDAATYTATFKLAYTVTYKAGEMGTGDTVMDTKLAGATLTIRNALFSRPLYVQDGWSETDGGALSSTYAFGATYSADANKTLYPHWTYVGDSFTYTIGMGSEATTASYSSSTIDQTPNITSMIPSRSGYHIAAWRSTGFFGNDPTINQTNGVYTLTIPAYTYGNFHIIPLWSADTAGVTAYAKWGGVSAITLPTVTERNGYTFGGWYKTTSFASADKVGDAGDSYTPDTSRTLYAQWTPATYTVKFVDADGTQRQVGTYTYSEGSATVLSDVELPSKTGHHIVAFTCNLTSGTLPYVVGTTVTIPISTYGNIVLTPQWEVNPITVKYDGNTNTSGTAPADSSFVYDVAGTIAEKGTLAKGYAITYDGKGGTPTKASDTCNYSFSVWANNREGTPTVSYTSGQENVKNPFGSTGDGLS